MNNNIVTYLKMKEILQFLWDKIKGNFVEHWGDLKYTTGYKYENLLDYDSKVDGKFFPNEGSGYVQDAWHWSIFHCPVKPNEEYTVLRKFGDSGRYVFYSQQGNVVEVLELGYGNNINDWRRNFVKVPDNPDIAHMAFCFQTYSNDLNVKGRIMLLKESNVTEKLDFIPYSNSTMVVVDGDKVAINFDSSSTTLTSTNVVSAIKELDGKIVNAGTGGQVTSVNGQQGNVTLNATHIDALVGGSTENVQQHMQNMNGNITLLFDTVNPLKNTVTTHGNRITVLENKLPTVQIGDIIQTFKDSGDTYTVGGVTYLYIGKIRTIAHATYPGLAPALGISGATNYQLPVINDINVIFDNGTKNRNRKHYIVASIR